MFIRENGGKVPEELEKKLADVQAITFYVLGQENSQVANYWTTVPDWPQVRDLIFYFHSNGVLSDSIPTSPNSFSTYLYDPGNPVPSIGGQELLIPCGPRDQSSLEARDDILIFTTGAFTENVAITGEITAVIYVASSALDTDFTVKVTDVYPDQRSILLADGIIRMKWRDGNEVPKLMENGVVYRVGVSLWQTSYIFEPGHSIRVAISSSNHPRFSANPNNGLLLSEGGPEVVASNTFYHDSARPSHIIFPLINLADIPENFFP